MAPQGLAQGLMAMTLVGDTRPQAPQAAQADRQADRQAQPPRGRHGRPGRCRGYSVERLARTPGGGLERCAYLIPRRLCKTPFRPLMKFPALDNGWAVLGGAGHLSLCRV